VALIMGLSTPLILELEADCGIQEKAVPTSMIASKVKNILKFRIN
jgi:hypothetical protein